MTDLKVIDVGTELPPLSLPPVNRTTLALFAGASHDHNPIHIDLDFARDAGMPDVFAHGMLSMAWAGRMLAGWADPRQLRAFSVRFVGITRLGDRITCTGKVVHRTVENGENLVKVALQTADERGEIKLTGEATIAL